MSNLSENDPSETLLNQPETSNDEAEIIKPRSLIEKTLKIYTVKIANFLAKYDWITPNRISILSALFGGPLACWLILENYYLIAVAVIIISGIFDDLDGDLARAKGVASKEGAILDSVLDRYVDFFIITALIFLDPSQHLIPGLLAMFGGMMVPYIRARSEAEGKSVVAAAIGNRTARFILIILGISTQQFFPLLILLAVTSNIAAFQRLFFALKTSIY
ncbi:MULTISPECIES: CDP-alcohol phosphatidyltransferase family protein [Planktothricoides]|uniref:CDP-alcohol phosphatidyltransferase family protein n=2 Tax=Planktothricoides raciborskii TaxID=132608 RepID=A0AAU8JGY6_9CYAN|nr:MULTISPECIES: CDP-alcohol phosphatidyltransferase family protein [Planktothricoides]KOR36166.1 CDP-alcohol phosphatidyltransferase [Planktothricoides sp. SR001]MBD2543716.1 CDP-alcohol phosphatidyltransferase family protein [Planktothricoides raciborskii FACHB-1370]MBD2582390.1 CDP-alcohol phosphatidyltransferase family protein [Planktothricoides raciborskii FACHB-1261]